MNGAVSASGKAFGKGSAKVTLQLDHIPELYAFLERKPAQKTQQE